MDETVVLHHLVRRQQGQLAKDVPEHTNVVADSEDDEHEAHRTEAVANDKDRVDVVVARLLVLGLLFVGLDEVLEAPFE